ERVTIWNRTAATAIIGITTVTTKNSRSRLRKDGVKRLRRRMLAAVRTGNLAAERVSQSQAPRLQSAFHGGPVNSCSPLLRGYSSVGRAPRSHPGGRACESP